MSLRTVADRYMVSVSGGSMGNTTWQKFVSRHIALETSEGKPASLPSVHHSSSLWKHSYGWNVIAKQQNAQHSRWGISSPASYSGCLGYKSEVGCQIVRRSPYFLFSTSMQTSKLFLKATTICPRILHRSLFIQHRSSDAAKSGHNGIATAGVRPRADRQIISPRK